MGLAGHEQLAAGSAAMPVGSQRVASLVGRAASLTVCVGALLVTGCSGPQSVLDPAGRGAERIAALFWGMTVGATVIWFTVIGLAIATWGYTYPVLRYLERQASMGSFEPPKVTLRRMMIAACLSGVALLGTWGTTQQAPTWAKTISEEAFKAEQSRLVVENRAAEANKLVKPKAKEHTLIWVSAGAIVGTILAAFMGDWSISAKGSYGDISATLTLTTIQVTDAGTYTVVVTNSAGSVTSSPATLTVETTGAVQLRVHRPNP